MLLGSDCVAFLIALGHARTIEQAEALGDSLISKKLIQHVTADHGLKNAFLFYRFLSFQSNEMEQSAEGSKLILHPMLPKFLSQILREVRSPSEENINRVIGQLKKRGNGRVRWNQRHIVIKGDSFMWKENLSSEKYNGIISLKHYICKPCKHLTSKNFSVFKLKDVNGNCLYFGSSNHAEVSNWVTKIHIIQAKCVSEVLSNLNLAFSEMMNRFNSKYDFNAKTKGLMKDPEKIASLVSSFRALSKSGTLDFSVDDLDIENVESEIMI